MVKVRAFVTEILNYSVSQTANGFSKKDEQNYQGCFWQNLRRIKTTDDEQRLGSNDRHIAYLILTARLDISSISHLRKKILTIPTS